MGIRNFKLKTKAAIALSAMLAVVLLSGCMKEGQQTEQTSNEGVNVELLFEKDGCKIYRFIDGIHAVYWTDCRGKVESVYQQKNGKSSHEERVQNETVAH